MKKGSICLLPIDNCPGIIVKVNDYIWASSFAVIPLATTVFYTAGVVEVVLQDQVK